MFLTADVCRFISFRQTDPFGIFARNTDLSHHVDIVADSIDWTLWWSGITCSITSRRFRECVCRRQNKFFAPEFSDIHNISVRQEPYKERVLKYLFLCRIVEFLCSTFRNIGTIKKSCHGQNQKNKCDWPFQNCFPCIDCADVFWMKLYFRPGA